MGVSVNGHDISDVTRGPQVDYPTGCNYSPMEPLDLSRTSTMFPFTHPPTPDEKPTIMTMFGASRQNSIVERQMSIDFDYEAPEIVTQPKPEWHYRNMKDLANKHIPLLSGNGPQRTPIRVKIPSRPSHGLFLSIQIVTIDNEPHPSKVIVPMKTQLKMTDRRHDNNLEPLDFHECNPNDRFDRETRIIYSLITPEESLAGFKDVRVYMFNLYQSQTITKERIESEKLHLCRLAFTLCRQVGENEWSPVSYTSYSTLIEEKRMNTRPRPSESSSEPTSQSIPYPTFYFGHASPDNMKENEIRFVMIPIMRPQK